MSAPAYCSKDTVRNEYHCVLFKNIQMSDKELIELLKKIVKPYIQNEEGFAQLSESTHLIDDLKINSANLVDVVLDIEDAFDIEIEDDAFENMLTVKAAMAVITEKVAAK